MIHVRAEKVISTILRHDRKVTSYKIALLRAINDIVFAFPDAGRLQQSVAVPLRMLAERWVAYYWPFCDPKQPVLQGQRAQRGGVLREDVSFRPQLTALRQAWDAMTGENGRASDGFFVINELHIPRRRGMLPARLRELYDSTLVAIVDALMQPIRYAGPKNWSVFERPTRYQDLVGPVSPVPGTKPADRCLVLPAELWATFHVMSLWVEALCLHEWALFTESVQIGGNGKIDRGTAYRLLTEWPENRRPLTWERNQVDLLIMEGQTFVCPWTGRQITKVGDYALDHLVPVSVYPTNELWNLVPADAHFNSYTKRDRLPAPERLVRAIPSLDATYSLYSMSSTLGSSLRHDAQARFAALHGTTPLPEAITQAVIGFITQVIAARNLPLFH